MKFLHCLPVQDNPKFTEEDEDKIPQEDDKVEILGAKWAIVVFLKDTISQIKFVGVLTVEVEKKKEQNQGSEKTSDVREGLVKLLKAPLSFYLLSSLPQE